MKENTLLSIKTWTELSPLELEQLNKSHAREWQIDPMSPEHHQENIFFLLKNPTGEILAQGQLVPINGIKFQDELFNILGIGGIIANIKGEGYGSEIMAAITQYLKKHHKTGVGFTGFGGFYEKCGFSVNKEAIKRFVYLDGDKSITNTQSDRVCYLDSDDQFMEKVLKNPHSFVYLPRTPDW